MRIYVASSWRNKRQQEVVVKLRAEGHDVYDFRHRDVAAPGVHWSEIDPEWWDWSVETFREELMHPRAQAAFAKDFKAMKWADACVLVMPCGRSAHLEAGWFVGQDKPVGILLSDGEPELMYLMATTLCGSMEEVLAFCKDEAKRGADYWHPVGPEQEPS